MKGIIKVQDIDFLLPEVERRESEDYVMADPVEGELKDMWLRYRLFSDYQ